MKVVNLNTLNDTIYEKFLKEKNTLKNLVYKEMELWQLNNNKYNRSIDFFKDALFVIDKGFDDILNNINDSNVEEKEKMLKNFKESFMYAIYEH